MITLRKTIFELTELKLPCIIELASGTWEVVAPPIKNKGPAKQHYRNKKTTNEICQNE